MKLTLFTSIVLVALLVCALTYSPSFGKLNETSSPLTDAEYRQRVEELLEVVLRKIEEVRGLSPPEETSLKVISVEWARENWGLKYVEANREEIKLEESIYKALFLLPEDANLAEVYIEWSGGYAAGVIGNDIFVVRENFNPEGAWAERTLAHEVTHLIQSEHFEISEREKHDEKQAWSALIEGDAELTAGKYVEEIKAEPLPKTSGAPAVGYVLPAYASSSDDFPIMRILYFPYDYGEDFVKTLFDEGGWNSVNQAYQDPPATTEQVMHPEKYFSKENPADVEKISLSLPGWRQVRDDRFGEHFVLVVLDAWISSEEAEEAAEGWGGDRFAYYEKNDQYLFVWKISWDSEKDALEFHDAWTRMMEALGAKEIGPYLWSVRHRYVQLTREGLTTLILGSDDLTALKPQKPVVPLVLTVLGIAVIGAAGFTWWMKREKSRKHG